MACSLLRQFFFSCILPELQHHFWPFHFYVLQLWPDPISLVRPCNLSCEDRLLDSSPELMILSRTWYFDFFSKAFPGFSWVSLHCSYVTLKFAIPAQCLCYCLALSRNSTTSAGAVTTDGRHLHPTHLKKVYLSFHNSISPPSGAFQTWNFNWQCFFVSIYGRLWSSVRPLFRVFMKSFIGFLQKIDTCYHLAGAQSKLEHRLPGMSLIIWVDNPHSQMYVMTNGQIFLRYGWLCSVFTNTWEEHIGCTKGTIVANKVRIFMWFIEYLPKQLTARASKGQKLHGWYCMWDWPRDPSISSVEYSISYERESTAQAI